MRALTLLLIVLISMIYPLFADATVITVRSDGTGDYTLVGPAVLASSPGDSIEVGPGTYYEPAMIDVIHSLTFYSTHGAAQTLLDGQSAQRVMRATGLGVTADISGLTFTHGYIAADVGGGLAISQDAVGYVMDCVFDANEMGGMAVTERSQATVARCAFTNNTGTSGTGGMYISGALPPPPTGNTHVDISDCEFRDNTAGGNGGAIRIVYGATMQLTASVFLDNAAPDYGGAVFSATDAEVDVSGCFFNGNTALYGSAIFIGPGHNSVVSNNTFHKNVTIAHGYPNHGTLVVNGTSNPQVIKNIFSNEVVGYGLWIGPDITCSHECNIYFANARGAIFGDGHGPAEVIANPQFCGDAEGNFTVRLYGPASPEGSACGELIGAYPVGCEPSLAILVSMFDAVVRPQSVQLTWDIAFDEPISGFRLERAEEETGAVTTLPRLGLIDESERSFVDEDVQPGQTYVYTLDVLDAQGDIIRSRPIRVTAANAAFTLAQNVPNPFNPSTSISYSLAEAADVSIDVFDVRGGHVRTLVSGLEAAGSKSVTWDGRDDRGEQVASGAYFYRLRAGSFVETRKMILLK